MGTNTVTISVDSIDGVKRRMKAAFAGKPQGSRITFASFDLMWRALAPNRMALLKMMAGAGPMTLREAARRVGRDVRAVHADVHLLLDSGVLDKLDDGRLEFPYDTMHLDVRVSQEAA